MLGGRLIVRSVRELLQGAEQLAGGNLAVQVLVRGSDELSGQANSFNRMLSALIRQYEFNHAAPKASR